MKTLPATGRLLAASLIAAGLAAMNVCGSTALAAAPAPAHDHAHAPTAKPLPPGQRWQTDATRAKA